MNDPRANAYTYPEMEERALTQRCLDCGAEPGDPCKGDRILHLARFDGWLRARDDYTHELVREIADNLGIEVDPDR